MSYAYIFSGFDFVLLQIVLQESGIMNQGNTIFAQIMSIVPKYEFDDTMETDMPSRKCSLRENF